MPHQPTDIRFAGVPALPVAEAAARRRLRSLERAHPGVLAWKVLLETSMQGEDEPYKALAAACIPGGTLLRGEAHGCDALGALRLAFNTLEQELEDEREGARHRAAQWLLAVKSRIGHLPGLR